MHASEYGTFCPCLTDAQDVRSRRYIARLRSRHREAITDSGRPAYYFLQVILLVLPFTFARVSSVTALGQ